MPVKRKRAISFDVMVKFFIKHYGIPTKKDIDKLNSRLDRLEHLIKKNAKSDDNSRTSKKKIQKDNGETTSSDKIFDIIKNSEHGIRFSEIIEKTGFDEKKLRNIIFRLKKTGRIKNKNRGIYVIGEEIRS